MTVTLQVLMLIPFRKNIEADISSSFFSDDFRLYMTELHILLNKF